MQIKVITKPIPAQDLMFNLEQLQLTEEEALDTESLKEYISSYYLDGVVVPEIDKIVYIKD